MNKDENPDRRGREDAMFVFSFAGAVVGIIIAIFILGVLELANVISITFKTFYP